MPAAARRKIEIDGREFCFNVPAPTKLEWESYWDNLEGEDRFFPYWLETWNSAFVMYFFLEKENFEILKGEVLEVAGGCGVFSQLIEEKLQHRYCFSDLVPEAVIFARRQIKNPLWQGVALDVTRSSICKKWPVILASDCLYHPEMSKLFCTFFQQHLLPGGRVILSDPNRHGVEASKNLRANWLGEIKLHEEKYVIDGHSRLYQIFEMTL